MQNPIVVWRETMGLSREVAAKALGISYSYQAALEQDRCASLSVRVLDGLAVAGVNVREFRKYWDSYMSARSLAAKVAANVNRIGNTCS